MPLPSVSLNIVYYTTFSPKWQEFTMFFGIKSRPICRHASEDVERDICATVSPMRCRVPALCLVPGINIHVVVEHRNTNLLIGFLNVFIILALVFLALTCVYVVRCLHEQVFQNGQSYGALELSNAKRAGRSFPTDGLFRPFRINQCWRMIAFLRPCSPGYLRIASSIK